MNPKITFHLLTLAITILLAGCGQEKEPVTVTEVTLSQTSLTMTEGDIQTLSATVQPSNADNKSLSWSSSNASVASVQDGCVTAHKAGSATITVKTADGGKTANCSVTVESKVIAVSSVILDKTSLELAEGDEITLTATVTPDNATNKSVSWTSSNSEVVTVENGKVTALKEGTTTITVTTEDGNKTATCHVIVNAKIVSVESVSLDREYIELIEGDEVTLVAAIEPNNATNKKVTWTSSDESVAIVAEGRIVAIKEGVTTITVTTEDDKKSDTCIVTVLHDVMSDAIVFADPIMKEMCVNAFDADGDGELSYKEASLVTSLDKLVISKKTINSFDELQYFTSVKSIPNDYFMGMGLISIILPEGLERIGSNAFKNCVKLSKITIPNSVFGIGHSVFEDCKNLKEVKISNRVKYVERSMFAGCVSLEDIIIPESVKSIEYKAFYHCSNLTNILIPSSVSSIGVYAFCGCSNLQRVMLSQNLEQIGESAFEGCENLVEVDIPNTITKIEDMLFYGCKSLTSISIPESVTIIGRSAFNNCSSLSIVMIPESVTIIEAAAFANCAFTSITLPNSISEISDSVFSGCTALENINIPNSIISIGSNAFRDCCNIASISIPESVTSIGYWAFAGCSKLNQINIPQKLVVLETSLFRDCVSLKSILLHENINTIEDSVFRGCSTLSSVYIETISPPSLIADYKGSKNHFIGNHPSRKIYVPSQSLQSYKADEGWSKYSDDIVGYNFENDKVVE